MRQDTRHTQSALTKQGSWKVACIYVLALALGALVGWMDLSATAVQATVLLLLLAGFSVALLGIGSSWLLGIACGVGVPVVHLFASRQSFSADVLLAIVPPLIGAVGGSYAGMLLQNASDQLDGADRGIESQQQQKGLGTRAILATALTVLAIVGTRSVALSLQQAGHPAALWLAICWQAGSYVGWIILTPAILRWREIASEFFGGSIDDVGIVSITEALAHVVAITVLVVIHALILVTLSGALFIPLGSSGFGGLVVVAVKTYLPLDILGWALITGLAFASDERRQSRATVMREKVLSAELVEAKLAALRAQLNPHFLYNALNAATVMSREGRSEDTARLLEELTALLRYALNNPSMNVCVRDELEFVQQYLRIQKVRFGTRLSYEVQCDAACESAMVPVFIMQPLVENAVEHGIASIISGGMVTVTVRESAGTLSITVENEGPQHTNLNHHVAGIGLGNTRARLEGAFASGASVELSERPGGGAIAQLRLPFTSLVSLNE